MTDRRPHILFDVTRMVIRVSLRAPTGIDRTAEAYAAWLLSRKDIELTPVCSWGGILWPMRESRLETLLAEMASRRVADKDSWNRILDALAPSAPQNEALRAKHKRNRLSATFRRYLPAIVRALADWRPRTIHKGATYLNVSHFGLEQPRLLDRLSASGIHAVAFVHDLIPIEHPEFCSPNAARLHLQRVQSVLKHANLVITNSRSTAEELKAFADRTKARTPRICAAPLGLEDAFLEPFGPPPSVSPYFVCVGTLEPRKNLVLLLKIWRRLADRLGDGTPHLILVGQRGWENESIIDQLERSPAILRFVHEADGLDDRQLARLIKGARALLAPSIIEGFDLPVSEAIALGTLVLASDIPVHREFAPTAHLIDPIDGIGWLNAIEAAAGSEKIAQPAQPRNWAQHFALVSQAMGLPYGADSSDHPNSDLYVTDYAPPKTAAHRAVLDVNAVRDAQSGGNLWSSIT